jgi:5-methyltetrahydropteroyltriglutamate--homocysteine methyltransferase
MATSSPYRADQVGSFLRPAELLEARRSGTAPEQLHALEDKHILRVLDKQKEIGVGVFSDGELRRSNFMSDFTDAVEGFDLGDSVARHWDDAAQKPSDETAPVSSITGIVKSRLIQREPLTGRELPFLREHAPGPIKMTLPSATQFPAISFKYGVTDAVYPDPFALLEAITAIMTADLKTLAGSVSYLQIDAPRYSYFLDPKWREWMETELRVDTEAMLTASLHADNACFAAAAQPGVTLAIHLCRGNNRSHWYAEGGYDAIAERLFHELAVDRFLLEYDDERSGGFAPLRFVPENKTVVLGLVSSKRAALESKRDLLRRIDEAAKVLPLEQLALSPQCGFASTMEGNDLTEADQWAKLQRVVETAREVWG